MNKRQVGRDIVDTKHKACTPVNKREEAKDTAQPTHQARIQVDKRQVAKDTDHTKHQACTPLNKQQVATDTAHTTNGVHTTLKKRRHSINTAHKKHQGRTTVNGRGRGDRPRQHNTRSTHIVLTTVKRPRTLHTEHTTTPTAEQAPSLREHRPPNTPSTRTGEQAASGHAIYIPEDYQETMPAHKCGSLLSISDGSLNPVLPSDLDQIVLKELSAENGGPTLLDLKKRSE